MKERTGLLKQCVWVLQLMHEQTFSRLQMKHQLHDNSYHQWVVSPSGALLEVATTTTPLLNSVTNSCFRIMASATSVTWQTAQEQKSHTGDTIRCVHVPSEVKFCSWRSMLISVNQLCSFSPIRVDMVTQSRARTHAQTDWVSFFSLRRERRRDDVAVRANQLHRCKRR